MGAVVVDMVAPCGTIKSNDRIRCKRRSAIVRRRVQGLSMSNPVEASEERLRRLAADISAAGLDRPVLKGNRRGLVVVAGGARICTNAYVLLHVLRSSLPVELWKGVQQAVETAQQEAEETVGGVMAPLRTALEAIPPEHFTELEGALEAELAREGVLAAGR